MSFVGVLHRVEISSIELLFAWGKKPKWHCDSCFYRVSCAELGADTSFTACTNIVEFITAVSEV